MRHHAVVVLDDAQVLADDAGVRHLVDGRARDIDRGGEQLVDRHVSIVPCHGSRATRGEAG